MTAAADVDGDGVRDRVALFVRKADRRLGLFVMLGAERTWTHVDAADPSTASVLDNPALVGVAGVEIAKPGRYATLCARGGDCDAAAPTEVMLKCPGIILSKRESWSVLFYWDSAARHFVSVPLTS